MINGINTDALHQRKFTCKQNKAPNLPNQVLYYSDTKNDGSWVIENVPVFKAGSFANSSGVVFDMDEAFVSSPEFLDLFKDVLFIIEHQDPEQFNLMTDYAKTPVAISISSGKYCDSFVLCDVKIFNKEVFKEISVNKRKGFSIGMVFDLPRTGVYHKLSKDDVKYCTLNHIAFTSRARASDACTLYLSQNPIALKEEKMEDPNTALANDQVQKIFESLAAQVTNITQNVANLQEAVGKTTLTLSSITEHNAQYEQHFKQVSEKLSLLLSSMEEEKEKNKKNTTDATSEKKEIEEAADDKEKEKEKDDKEKKPESLMLSFQAPDDEVMRISDGFQELIFKQK